MIYRFIALSVFLATTALGLSRAAGEVNSTTGSDRDMTIETFGGAYGQALEMTVLKPFKDKTNIRITPLHRSQGDEPVFVLGAGGDRPDVIELDRRNIDSACASGLITKRAGVTPSGSNPSGSDKNDGAVTSDAANDEDLLDGFHHDCGVASLTWSAVTVFNTKKLSKRPPRSLNDLFKTRTFPGKRAFVAKPEFLFETILIADGVKPRDVYSTLDTEKGVKRVLNRLARLEKHITWTDTPTAALELVESGQAVMGQAFNGRVFIDSARGAPIEILWDGQIYDTNYYAIPANARDQKRSADFVAFATETAQLANHAEQLAYGPLRRSAIARLKRHSTLGIDLEAYLPTHPNNRKRALQRNAAWWVENKPRLDQAFANWRSEEALRAEQRAKQAAKPRKKRRYRKRRRKRRRNR